LDFARQGTPYVKESNKDSRIILDLVRG